MWLYFTCKVRVKVRVCESRSESLREKSAPFTYSGFWSRVLFFISILSLFDENAPIIEINLPLLKKSAPFTYSGFGVF